MIGLNCSIPKFTHDVVVRIKEDLERREKLLDSFKDALHRCCA